MIPIEKCINGGLYRLSARNLVLGVWNPQHHGFVGIREKLGSRYLDHEIHRGRKGAYATAAPMEHLGMLPVGIGPHQFEVHDKGDSWALRDGVWVGVLRQNLAPSEKPHGSRQGFEDTWLDTDERLPDDLYPRYRQNEKLFEFLKKFQSQPPA